MAGHLNRGGQIVVHGGAGFQAGHWRADAPTGTVAVPEGPQVPIERPDDDILPDGRRRDPRTAANLNARAEALTPRRYRPTTPAT